MQNPVQGAQIWVHKWLSGRVKRYHQTEGNVQQNIADHTFGVLVLLLDIYPAASSNLLRAAIYHDMPEAKVGDIPSPIKDDSGIKAAIEDLEDQWLEDVGIVFPPLTEEEMDLLYVCDVLECVMFSALMISMGNKLYRPILYRAVINIQKFMEKSSFSDEIKQNVISKINHLNRLLDYREGDRVVT